MPTKFDAKLQAMLQSLYRNGAANADFIPVPEGLESYSSDAILETHNMGYYADPHLLEPGLVKDALESLKERAERGDKLQDPLARLGVELLRVMSSTVNWEDDLPVIAAPAIRPILVESRFTGTVEETFSFDGDFKEFSQGFQVRLSAKYPVSAQRLEILDKKILHAGSAVSQVKVLFQIVYLLWRELDVPGPPVPVFATVTHSGQPLPEVSREVANVRHWPKYDSVGAGYKDD